MVTSVYYDYFLKEGEKLVTVSVIHRWKNKEY